MEKSKNKQKKTAKLAQKKSHKNSVTLKGITLRLSDVRLIPIAIVTLGCWYIFVGSIPEMFQTLFQGYTYYLFYLSSLFTLIIATFGTLYIYRFVHRAKINRYVHTIAAIFVAIPLFCLIYIFTGIGQECTGLFGTTTDCADWNAFVVAVLLFNPVSAVVFGILAFVGLYRLEPAIRKRLNVFDR